MKQPRLFEYTLPRGRAHKHPSRLGGVAAISLRNPTCSRIARVAFGYAHGGTRRTFGGYVDWLDGMEASRRSYSPGEIGLEAFT